jgi:hypothetical protein
MSVDINSVDQVSHAVVIRHHFYPEDGGNKYLQNFATYQAAYTASWHKIYNINYIKNLCFNSGNYASYNQNGNYFEIIQHFSFAYIFVWVRKLDFDGLTVTKN